MLIGYPKALQEGVCTGAGPQSLDAHLLSLLSVFLLFFFNLSPSRESKKSNYFSWFVEIIYRGSKNTKPHFAQLDENIAVAASYRYLSRE